MAGTGLIERNSPNGVSNDGLGISGIAGEILNDHFDRHRLLLDLPGIVISDHGEHGVRDFCFSSAFCFSQGCHADDGKTFMVVKARFGASAEGWPFHINVSPAIMNPNSPRAATRVQNPPKLVANRVCKRNVSHYAMAKKCLVRVAFGPIKELVGQHDIARLKLPLQGTDRAHCYDPARAQLFEHMDVRPMVKFARKDPVPSSVARKKCDRATVQLASEDGIRGRPKGSSDRGPFLTGESFNLIKAASPDNSNTICQYGSFWHGGYFL